METVDEKLKKYIELTKIAINSVYPVNSEGELLIDMAKRYLSDTFYHVEKGDVVTALVSIVYAYAWLDIGVYTGKLKTDKPELFMGD